MHQNLRKFLKSQTWMNSKPLPLQQASQILEMDAQLTTSTVGFWHGWLETEEMLPSVVCGLSSREKQCFFYVTDGWSVYPMFIEDANHLVSKTYMTRVEGENTRLRHYLARLHRQTLCYSKSLEMLKCSIRLLLYYLKYKTIPLPV